MKSIKPGRGPSGMSAIGGIVAVIFGIFWIGLASNITSGMGGVASFFPIFGVLFVVMAIVGVVYNLRNATSKNRFSAFDITNESEEPDPLNELFGEQNRQEDSQQSLNNPTVRERLGKLDGLRDDKLITEEEYQAQRKTIISSL